MTYQFGKKKTPVRVFFNRLLLRSAALGALVGVGYNAYSTRQEVTATITGVDVLSPATDGAPAELLILTDRGTFNNPAPLTLPPVTPPPLTPQAVEIPPLPPLQTPISTDITLPRVCVDAADTQALALQAPQIYRDLASLQQLQLTGREVFNFAVDRNNTLRTCLVPYGEGNVYSAGMLTVERAADTAFAFHELFHAHQRAMEGQTALKLTTDDYLVHNMLTEATAMAYGLLTKKEAELRGVVLYDNPRYREFGEDAGIRRLFDEAYKQAYESQLALPEYQRLAKSLEAGGQAVVRALLLGDNLAWKNTYAQIIVDNANNSLAFTGRNNREAAGYYAARAEAFRSTGRVSADINADINIVPVEYLRPDADQLIARNIRAFDILTAPVARAFTARPQGPA